MILSRKLTVTWLLENAVIGFFFFAACVHDSFFVSHQSHSCLKNAAMGSDFLFSHLSLCSFFTTSWLASGWKRCNFFTEYMNTEIVFVCL